MAAPQPKKQRLCDTTDEAGTSHCNDEPYLKIDLTKIKKEERRQFERSLRLAVSIQCTYGAKLCKIVQNRALLNTANYTPFSMGTLQNKFVLVLIHLGLALDIEIK